MSCDNCCFPYSRCECPVEIPLGELAALRVGLREARELLEQAYGVAHRELQAEIAAFLDRASKGKP